ncbi:MAG: invasion associated locus B family protein [Cucumibacter sp.]
MIDRLSLAALLVCLAAGGAEAATKLGEHNYWIAWQDTDAAGKICYISSQPQTVDPTTVTRSPIYFTVTHRAGSDKRNEVATIIGYPFLAGEAASAEIDGRAYPMVTDMASEAGWLASVADEPAFIEAMKAGTALVVKGVSTRGTHTTDTYSLSGVTAAMADIDTACP